MVSKTVVIALGKCRRSHKASKVLAICRTKVLWNFRLEGKLPSYNTTCNTQNFFKYYFRKKNTIESRSIGPYPIIHKATKGRLDSLVKWKLNEMWRNRATNNKDFISWQQKFQKSDFVYGRHVCMFICVVKKTRGYVRMAMYGFISHGPFNNLCTKSFNEKCS